MMKFFEIVMELFPFVAPVLASIFSFIMGRRSQKAKMEQEEAGVTTAELLNVEKAIGIYRKIAEDLTKQIVELQLQLHKVSEQNRKLALQNDELMQENKLMKSKLDKLELKLNEFNKKQ